MTKMASKRPQMAKIFIKSGENECLLKIKSGELYFNVEKVVAKEKFNPEQALEHYQKCIVTDWTSLQFSRLPTKISVHTTPMRE